MPWVEGEGVVGLGVTYICTVMVVSTHINFKYT